jgi:hypothetical protein
MIKDNKDNSYNFGIRGSEYEIFYNEDKSVEIYEVKNPGKTGFIFSNEKAFHLFINSITDAASRHQEKEGDIF